MLKLSRSLFWGSLLGLVLFVSQSMASMEVLFHPQDPTLEKIADYFAKAQSHIEIAMYNMETSNKSPLIVALASEPLKSRIAKGELKIRVIFEGYGKPEDNNKKMQDLEDLGLDVRFLGAGKMIHHKFAVIDMGTAQPMLITGSANWSLSSRQYYSENIVFMQNEQTITAQYSQEFEKLWSYSHEFGKSLPVAQFVNVYEAINPDLFAVFNSDNFVFSQTSVVSKSPNTSVVTDFLKSQIHKAEKSLQIASTRLHLVPLMEEIKAAVARNVKVQIIVSQDEFSTGLRGPLRDLLKENPAIELRVKFYDLRPWNYLLRQMHNKYMIVDGKKIYTGSFNWSPSSENTYIENELSISGEKYPLVLQSYLSNFSMLWDMNRQMYAPLFEKLNSKQTVSCALEPMVLTVSEIYALLKLNRATPCLAAQQAGPEVPKPEDGDGGQ